MTLRQKREAELKRIREVLLHNPVPRKPADVFDASLVGRATRRSMQGWRGMEDHEARWQFLEETCFFGHNLGYKKIRKKYTKDEVLMKETPSDSSTEDESRGFGETKYLRKYMVSNNYVTHEADPMFHEPLENVLDFLCNEREETVIIPFYVLPFPSSFMGLSLEDHLQGTHLALELEGDPDQHRRTRVSDYSIPQGNNFLNDPISYNKTSANVSLPVKLML